MLFSSSGHFSILITKVSQNLPVPNSSIIDRIIEVNDGASREYELLSRWSTVRHQAICQGNRCVSALGRKGTHCLDQLSQGATQDFMGEILFNASAQNSIWAQREHCQGALLSGSH